MGQTIAICTLYGAYVLACFFFIFGYVAANDGENMLCKNSGDSNSFYRAQTNTVPGDPIAVCFMCAIACEVFAFVCVWAECVGWCL